jgi:hypothetical protein
MKRKPEDRRQDDRREKEVPTDPNKRNSPRRTGKDRRDK